MSHVYDQTHFFTRFTVSLADLNLSSRFLALLRCCSHDSPYTITSSTYVSLTIFKLGNNLVYHPLESCRGIFLAKRHDLVLKNPFGVTKAEISLALLDKGTCQYPLSKSRFVTHLECPMWSIQPFTLGIGNESDFVTEFTLSFMIS